MIPAIVDQVARGQDEIALGNVKPKHDYVYAADVADALLAIAAGADRPYRVYNVGTGQEYSVEEIVAELARITGRPLRIAVAEDRVRPVDRLHLLSDRSRIGREVGWQPRYTFTGGLAELWQSRSPGGAGGSGTPS